MNKKVSEADVTLYFEENNTLTIEGSIDSQNPNSFMDPFFKEVHEYLISNRVDEIKVDVRGLTYLNSSGIREIILWLMKIMQTPPDDQYRVVFMCNEKYTWQESAMSNFILLNEKLFSKVTM